MKKKGVVRGLALMVLVSAGCTSGRDVDATIQIDGSSTVYPITEAVAEEYRLVAPQVRVTVGVSGTGGGFSKFCRGETDLSNASRPVKASEIELCARHRVEFIELPIAYDGIVVVVHPQNHWVDSLSIEELKGMWEPAAQGRIRRWNQVRPDWPDQEMHLFAPGIDSGTYDYFTQAVVGQEGASRGDLTTSEDDNVLVQGVSTDPYALGFFGYAYYAENRSRLKIVPISSAETEGQAVFPTPETIEQGRYQPLSRPVFLYVRGAAAEHPGVDRFVRFYLEQAAELVPLVGYIAMPRPVYELALHRFERRITGTVFEQGTQVGISVEDLLKMEPGRQSQP